MKTTLIAAAGLLAAASTAAYAQAPQAPAQDSASDGGLGVRSGHVTSTGETVPNPGVSQGAGTTSLDRGIQERDNKIDSGICKGC